MLERRAGFALIRGGSNHNCLILKGIKVNRFSTFKPDRRFLLHFIVNHFHYLDTIVSLFREEKLRGKWWNGDAGYFLLKLQPRIRRADFFLYYTMPARQKNCTVAA
jgi:hypothetical protein